jgi:hypothetical protein
MLYRTSRKPSGQGSLRGALLWSWCAFGSTSDENTILLPFMKRGLREGQWVNIIDERRRGEKVGWPVVDVD